MGPEKAFNVELCHDRNDAAKRTTSEGAHDFVVIALSSSVLWTYAFIILYPHRSCQECKKIMRSLTCRFPVWSISLVIIARTFHSRRATRYRTMHFQTMLWPFPPPREAFAPSSISFPSSYDLPNIALRKLPMQRSFLRSAMMLFTLHISRCYLSDWPFPSRRSCPFIISPVHLLFTWDVECLNPRTSKYIVLVLGCTQILSIRDQYIELVFFEPD